jgi:hypothetical protein
VRDLLALDRDAFSHTFTLKDFVHRIESMPRTGDTGDTGESDGAADLSEALTEINAGRTLDSVLGTSDTDDVRDPIGESPAVWTAVTQELVDYSDRLAFVLSYARPRAERVGRRTQHRR